jgi:hypothetical protein
VGLQPSWLEQIEQSLRGAFSSRYVPPRQTPLSLSRELRESLPDFGDYLYNSADALSRIPRDVAGMYEDFRNDPLDFLSKAGPGLAGLGMAIPVVGGGAAIAETRATTTVGRFMSRAELDKMLATGRVQESTGKGITSVTFPPNPSLYRAGPKGDTFVQFDVPLSAVRATGTGTGKIYGPNSVFGPHFGITEMPRATNILVKK